MSRGIFAERMRETRLELGMSQAQLARKMGMSQQAISSIEGGRRESYLFTALCVADALGVSLDYLAGRTDVKEVKK
jgi:transcriptional regulator with XRE-family HTH domain